MAVDAATVKNTVETDLVDAVVNQMIQTAERIVVQYIDPYDVSADIREEIHLWLSAHFVAIRDRQATSEAAGNVSFKYDGQTAMHLNATLWGQQAMVIDPTGELAKLSQKRRPLRFSINRPETDSD